MTRCPDSSGLAAWWLRGARLLVRDVRRHRLLFALLGLAWTLALVRLFVDHRPLLPLLFNWTPSLPYRVVYAAYSAKSFARGDLVVYRFDGQAGRRDYPGLRQQPFFKRIAGVAGDAVTVRGREVFVNGASVGHAKTHAFDGRPLQPIEDGVIPDGFLYVQGTSPDSFDSRYRASGLVHERDVLAKVRPLL